MRKSGEQPAGETTADATVEGRAQAEDRGSSGTGRGTGTTERAAAFDFGAHRRDAVDSYDGVRQDYEDCSQAVYSVLKTALDAEGLLVHSLEARGKTTESLGRKAASPSENDPGQPKYPNPLVDITDLAGVRVITFLLYTVDRVNEIIEREFDVVEKSSKSGLVEEGERLGYQSVHYLVRFSPARCALPEYARFSKLVTEVQVRTILQHAWAEIEHDIQYKAVETIPSSIRERFTSLAGLIAIADREFQAISDEDRRRRNDARRLIAQGTLDRVELTPDALKVYLDEKYGPDGRMSEWSYGWATRVLKRLGFTNLAQVAACIGSYDDDHVSRALWGSRQGQLSRFENVLLAAMGEEYIRRHPWAQNEWMTRLHTRRLQRLREAGVPIGAYDPLVG
jgi:ppGpp synthetase/RelA/SpoT-type nucleotidyltranferase